MTYTCAGQASNGAPCKSKVQFMGQFCSFHIGQQDTVEMCKCLLLNGRNCPYEAIKNGLCAYHQDIKYCQGRTLLGGTCLRMIPSGKFCINCKSQEGVIFDHVKTAADEYRSFLTKKGEPVISKKEAVTVNLGFNVNTVKIPKDLEKVELLKPDECVICLEEMEKKYRALTCGHYFHDKCLAGLYSFECPMCRGKIWKHKIPKWVKLRIRSNMEKDKIDKEQEQEQASLEMVRGIFENQISDFVELQGYLGEGDLLEMGMVSDDNGGQVLAIYIVDDEI